MRRLWLRRLVLFVVIVAGLYGLVRLNRSELVDFVVPRTAATRFSAHEELYRPEDGHYQYKYLPAFAALFIPFTWLPKEPAQLAWFALLVAMTWGFLRMSIEALPDRRLSERALFWFTLLLTGKFLVKELAFGQFNLPVALLMLGAVIAAQRRRTLAAGALVAAGVFVKPYALVLVPWLFFSLGWRSLVTFAIVMASGLLLPVASYGWDGNLDLLNGWYRTVTDTVAPNLMGPENISFASMWAKWIGPGEQASRFALVLSAIAVAAGILVMAWRRGVSEPNYLEAAYFFVLIPVLSPQGWDYVLILALPAYMLLVDRYRDLSPNWRMVMLTAFLFTSFTIFDLLRRALYTHLMLLAAPSIGAMLIAICLMRLRWRKIA